MSSDLRNAALGDVVREQLSAPEIDGTTVTRAGGGVAGSGQGGETVARQALVPAEGTTVRHVNRLARTTAATGSEVAGGRPTSSRPCALRAPG